MKHIKTLKKPGVARFFVDEDIDLNEFRSLMRELAATLNSNIEWISIPEAEIGKIKLKTGEIYGKLDLEYGLELDCDGASDNEISKIAATLSAK